MVADNGSPPDSIVFSLVRSGLGEGSKHRHCNDKGCTCQHKPIGSWKGKTE